MSRLYSTDPAPDPASATTEALLDAFVRDQIRRANELRAVASALVKQAEDLEASAGRLLDRLTPEEADDDGRLVEEPRTSNPEGQRIRARRAIRRPEDVAAAAGIDLIALDQEQLRVLLLDTKNRVMGTVLVYQGTVNRAPTRVAEIYREAVRQAAVAIAVVHNHPSGDPEPSTADIALTKQLAAAGDLLDVELVDHVVVGREGLVSLRQNGLGF